MCIYEILKRQLKCFKWRAGIYASKQPWSNCGPTLHSPSSSRLQSNSSMWSENLLELCEIFSERHIYPPVDTFPLLPAGDSLGNSYFLGSIVLISRPGTHVCLQTSFISVKPVTGLYYVLTP